MREEAMRLALQEAEQAYREGEVPVGAVVLRGNEVLSAAHNRCIAEKDPCLHAELLAMKEASRKTGGFLTDCTLFVTLEPCAMCAGAALHYRLGALYFGAFEEKTGCCGSVLDVTDGSFPHSIPCFGGFMEAECAALLSRFFENLRS